MWNRFEAPFPNDSLVSIAAIGPGLNETPVGDTFHKASLREKPVAEDKGEIDDKT
jgi:hypothetical protein